MPLLPMVAPMGPDPDRRELHHDPGELEHHVRQALAERKHGVLGLALHLRQRRRKQQGKEHDLEHFVLGRRVEEGSGHGVLDHASQGGVGAGQLAPLVGGHGQAHAHTGLDGVDRNQPDGQRQRGDDFEVDDRPERQAAHLLHVVAVARDADHQAAEQQRYHDRLDHPEEDRGQELEDDDQVGILPDIVIEPAEDHADDRGDDDPGGEAEFPHESRGKIVKKAERGERREERGNPIQVQGLSPLSPLLSPQWQRRACSILPAQRLSSRSPTAGW